MALGVGSATEEIDAPQASWGIPHMNSMAVDAVLKFHLSLNVSDLERSVAFFGTLFGCSAKKHHADYAKFEPDQLPLVLSLEPGCRIAAGSAQDGPSTVEPGPLNHLGIRMVDAAALVEVQRRLESAGIFTLREEGVECCYARQTKFWVRDPDANLWEIYVLEEDIAHRGTGQAGLNVLDAGQRQLDHVRQAQAASVPGEPASWVHRLDEDSSPRPAP